MKSTFVVYIAFGFLVVSVAALFITCIYALHVSLHLLSGDFIPHYLYLLDGWNWTQHKIYLKRNMLSFCLDG